jgi:pimeloyl-ACP methyl ester carboxylesterase
VAALLRNQGFAVHTPTQTGLGERAPLLSRDITLDTFVDDVAGLLRSEDLRNVVLVGHSFGGNAITGVADRLPERLRHLVYLDAAIPTAGQSVFDGIAPHIVAKIRAASEDSSGGLSMAVPPAKAFGVTDPDQAAWVMAHCTPHPISTYDTPITLAHPVANGVPATYIAVTPHYAPTADARAFAQAQAQSRPDWQYLELAAGHDAMVTHPRELARLLVQIAGGQASF